MSTVITDQEDTLSKSITEKDRQVSLRDEPQQKTSDPEQPVTLYPPMLSKDGTEVTGAKKHHLKKQNKQRRIEKQLGQVRRSYWKTHHGTRGADHKVPVPAAEH